jgi:hypothetical protein
VAFPVDFTADEGPETYRCRLTIRGTLLCLSNTDNGREFRKMTVDPTLIYDGR